jgi:hypothetical protein
MEVCFAVRMRLVAVDVDVMNRNGNAVTRKRRRLEGRKRRRRANWGGETRAGKCGCADILCAVLRPRDMQPRTYHSRIWVEAVCMVILYERSWEAARSTRAAGTCNDPTKKRRARDSATLTARGPQLVVCPPALAPEANGPSSNNNGAGLTHSALNNTLQPTVQQPFSMIRAADRRLRICARSLSAVRCAASQHPRALRNMRRIVDDARRCLPFILVWPVSCG